MQPIVTESAFARVVNQLQRISGLASADAVLKRVREFNTAMGNPFEEKKKPLSKQES